MEISFANCRQFLKAHHWKIEALLVYPLKAHLAHSGRSYVQTSRRSGNPRHYLGALELPSSALRAPVFAARHIAALKLSYGLTLTLASVSDEQAPRGR